MFECCTKCGRKLPEDEVAHYQRRKTESGIEYILLCALHTHHDRGGNWDNTEEYRVSGE